MFVFNEFLQSCKIATQSLRFLRHCKSQNFPKSSDASMMKARRSQKMVVNHFSNYDMRFYCESIVIEDN